MSSSTGVRKETTQDSRIIRGLIDNDKAFVDSLKPFSSESALSGFGGSGSTSGGGGTAGGNFLSKAGDIMNGFLSLRPVSVQITNDIVDLAVLDDQSNRLVITGEGAADDDVKFIKLVDPVPAIPFLIQGIIGINLTFKHQDPSPPDSFHKKIRTFDGSDFILSGNQNVWAVYDSIADEVTLLSGGGFTEPQQFTVKDYGDVSLVTVNVTADTHNIHKMRLTGDIGITINSTLAATKFEMIHLHLVQDGTGGHSVTSWTGVNGTPSIDTTPDSVTTVSLFSLDSGVTWFFVSQKGGVVGGGGADNLGDHTATQDIDFATFDGINIDRILFDQTAGNALAASSTGITSDVASNLNHNVPTGASYVYKVNDGVTNAFQIGATSVLSQTISPMEAALDDLGLIAVPWRHAYINDITVGGATKGIDGIGELTFVDNTATPTGNGIFYFDGTDLKAKTGSLVKNLSDIGGGSLVDLIANEAIVVTNLTIWDDLQDMIINIGTIGKKVRIREQNITPSLFSIGNAGADLEVFLDMHQNNIDNIERAVFGAGAVGAPSSREIYGNADGLVFNTANTKIIEMRENGTAFLEMDSSVLKPSIDNVVDLGVNGTNRFRDLHLSRDADIVGGIIVGSEASLFGNVILGNSASDSIVVNGVIGSDVNFDDRGITKINDIIFSDGLGNDVATIQGINGSPDNFSIKLGPGSDFSITDNGLVRMSFDNVLLTWDFQGANILKLPQETMISDRTIAPSTPPSGQMSLYVINSSGAQTLKVKFDNGTEKTIADDT